MAEKKSNKKRFILIGLGVAATGLLSYFGWEYYQKRKNESEEDNEILQPPQKSAFVPTFFHQQNPNDDFPLKKDSKGPRVKSLQDSLIAKYGREILPRYGADGDFGNELQSALKKLSLPMVIDESTFNVIVKASTANPKEIAKQLYKDAVNRNLAAVISSLKKIRSQEEYSQVSREFQNYRIGGVRQTLVNGILNSFSDEKQKQQIRMEFTRMGLKYDGSKWSLSGTDGLTVITKERTIVWRTPSEGAKVPAKMILGTEIATREGFTLFENNGKKFLVKSTAVKYL